VYVVLKFTVVISRAGLFTASEACLIHVHCLWHFVFLLVNE